MRFVIDESHECNGKRDTYHNLKAVCDSCFPAMEAEAGTGAGRGAGAGGKGKGNGNGTGTGGAGAGAGAGAGTVVWPRLPVLAMSAVGSKNTIDEQEERAATFSGWLFSLISLGPPHVRCTPMWTHVGHTCGGQTKPN